MSLYDLETANRVIEQCKTDPGLVTLSGYETRHIRAEQVRRLANWREMVKHLEGIKLP